MTITARHSIDDVSGAPVYVAAGPGADLVAARLRAGGAEVVTAPRPAGESEDDHLDALAEAARRVRGCGAVVVPADGWTDEGTRLAARVMGRRGGMILLYDARQAPDELAEIDLDDVERIAHGLALA